MCEAWRRRTNVGDAQMSATHKCRRRRSVLKYRVPHGSQPRPGWAPDPLMVVIKSPDGLVVGLAPATLELWVRFPCHPKREEPGKTGRHPVLKYWVPHGSQRDGQTSPHRPRLVISRSTCPPLSPSPLPTQTALY
jgi:hypothetical protein